MQRRNFLATVAAAGVASAQPGKLGTLFVGAWQKRVLVIDEATKKVTGEIELKLDVPRSMMWSEDKKKIIVHCQKGCGFEIIDVATRKLERSFMIDGGGKMYRPSGFAISPDDKRMYTALYTVEKKVDRFEVTKPQWAVIDMANEKLDKVADLPKDQQLRGGGGRGGGLRVSPDGKLLYQFRDNVNIYSTDDLQGSGQD